MEFLEILFFSVLGGLLPALFWLCFWLKEDKNPEPKKLILKSFIYGMLAVPFALICQYVVNYLLLNGQIIEIVFVENFPIAIITIFLWAFFEEYFKYQAAYRSGLQNRANDEPIDAMMYMITSALGFAALENIFFIFNPISHNQATVALITGSFRFIGSTMLHVATSAIIGYFISISFYKNKAAQKCSLYFGFTLAVVLHTIFNSFIIKSNNFTITSFAIVWITIIIIIISFEKVKSIYIKKTK